ncbi:glycosyltransferase family 2 protein [Tropicimonas sediminicola]|uniref:Glycosyl transferase family 2 n=1 Tax=Tropicimonas sediminicola TaxID=1031541 RepID=A0A239LWY8_9RHOB|nr:glycosyltransferase family 2 protein [Tropicimonas sediminicola]SNT34885.1 Glycosyl transferase family 2 [Tropicimonas sediminicola]
MAQDFSWGVVATVREPADLVLAFAAHHLGLGAAEVTLFFDDPEDPGAALLEQVPGCTVHRCGEDYWQGTRRRERPALQSQRQMLNATWTYNRTSVDWLLHIDADEFLHLPTPLGEELEALRPGDGWLKIRNFERVWRPGTQGDTIFDGVFRKPVKDADDDLARIYGSKARFLWNGFAGHPIGKALSATGRDFRINTHSPRAGRGTENHLPPYRTARHAALLHFDGLTPLHWAAKTLRYAEQGDAAIDALLHPQRQAQVRHVRDACPDLRAILDFHGDLFHLSEQEDLALSLIGALSSAKIDPEAEIARLLPGHRPRFETRHFDEMLGPENAARLMTRVPGASR